MRKSGSLLGMSSQLDAQELIRRFASDEQLRLRYAAEVKPARVRQRLTQDDVATSAGVSRNTVVAMERGGSVPQAEKLVRVMLVLGIAPESEAPEWLQEWWRVIAPLASQLPEETRGVALGQIVHLLYQGMPGDAEPNRVTKLPPLRDLAENILPSRGRLLAASDDYPGEDQLAEIESWGDSP